MPAAHREGALIGSFRLFIRKGLCCPLKNAWSLSATQAEGTAYFIHFAGQLRGRKLPLSINDALQSAGE